MTWRCPHIFEDDCLKKYLFKVTNPPNSINPQQKLCEKVRFSGWLASFSNLGAGCKKINFPKHSCQYSWRHGRDFEKAITVCFTSWECFQ